MRGNTVRSILFLLFILLLGAGAIYVDLPSPPAINIGSTAKGQGLHIGSYNNALEVKQGLDLKGGIELVLQGSCPSDQPKCDIGTLMPAALNAVQKRVSGGLGVNDAVVRQQGNDHILVELPGLQDPQQANALLGKTGKMEIINTNGTPLAIGTQVTAGQYPVVFTGAQLDPNSINATLDQNNSPIVTFEFQGPARSAFATYTRQNTGGYLTVTLDGTVIESAQIQSEIDGQGEINGMTSVTAAQDLATQLKYGALPLPLAVVSEQQLAATLGQQAIQYSIRAALIGLGLVMLFMLIYYRLPGLLADIALLLYTAFIFAAIKLLGVTLSLEGIAATVLTIGMAVDANILIFERMKEELRAGRTMASAIDLGFKRAWPSIRDSNASTIITGAILYWFGSNYGATIIVGFATNLIIGVVLSLFTAVVVTRNFLNLLQFSGVATHPALYSLPADALKVSRYNPRQRVASRRPSVVAPSAAPAAALTTIDVDADEAATNDEALAGVGAGANGAKPATARLAEEQTGAEE